ncbi:MAG: hypothetical protein SH817_17785 [Leptospira sp.]|nr:hypothetical protein [Leptospira sp.]
MSPLPMETRFAGRRERSNSGIFIMDYGNLFLLDEFSLFGYK